MVIVTKFGKNRTDDINLIVYKRLRSDGSQSLEIVWGSSNDKLEDRAPSARIDVNRNFIGDPDRFDSRPSQRRDHQEESSGSS